MNYRQLPFFVENYTWQMKWLEDTTLDDLHQLCKNLSAPDIDSKQRWAIQRAIKKLCDERAIFQFIGHVKTYGIGPVGDIGELPIPLNARGVLKAYRGKTIRIVQSASGRHDREFSVIREDL